MRKIIYTLILCFFALNLSADIYIVSTNLSNLTVTDILSGQQIPVETKSSRAGYNYVYKISNLEEGLFLNFEFGSKSYSAWSGEGIKNNSIYRFYTNGDDIGLTKLDNSTINVTVNLTVRGSAPYPQDAFLGVKADYCSSVKYTSNQATYSFFKVLNPDGASILFPSIIYINNRTLDNNATTAGGTSVHSLQNNDIIEWSPTYRLINGEHCFLTSTGQVTKIVNLVENKTYTGSESREISTEYLASSYNKFGNITYSMTYSKAEVKDWLFISAPYDATVEVYINGVGNIPLTYTNDPNKNYQYSCFLLRSFNGQKRANGEANYWDEMKTPTIEAGKGYILGIDPRNNNGDIKVTYKSISSTNTRSTDIKIDFPSYTGKFEAGHNQHLRGTGLFFNSSLIRNNDGAQTICQIAIPGQDGYSYEIAMGNITNCTLKPFSAFFFKCKGSISIAERTMSNNAPMARSKNNSDTTTNFECYNIKINNEGISKETTILMNNDGTQGAGDDGDFLYFTTNIGGIPFANQFYSINQDYAFAFNHCKKENQAISLGGCLANAGDYTISLNGKNTTAKSVLLTDTYDGTTTELTTDSYTFSVNDSVVLNNRFIVTFSFAPDMPTDTYITEANQIIVYGNADNCNISNLTTDEIVMIYDATGRLVYNQIAQTDNLNITLIPGTYIVRQADKWTKFNIANR